MLSRRGFLRTATLAGGFWVVGRVPGARSLADAPKSKWPDNPFLQGNFAPVEEELTVDRLKVVGHIPDGLRGMFVRNGPNPQFPPIKSYHWFEGDGMLHGVRIEDGRASYRNRYIRNAGWTEEHKSGRAVYPSFLDPPDLRQLAATGGKMKNTANTALVWHDGRLLALMEAAEPTAIELPELKTVGPHKFSDKLVHPFTAHPKVDPETGEMLCFGYQFMSQPYLQYSVVNARGELVSTTPVDLPRPIMMHDFAITKNYTIFMDLPETFDLGRAIRGESPLKFEAELGARFGILPRHGRGEDIRWFESPACFVFHTLNAYESGDEVVLLACRNDIFPEAADFVPRTSKDLATAGEALGGAVLYRWRFNLKTGNVSEGALDDTPSEFPRVNDRLAGRPTRFGYVGREGGGMFDGLIKYDLDAGGREKHVHGRNRRGGEGVFVPRPGGTAEDDGWLLTFIHDFDRGQSELVVIDARDFASPPVARIMIPGRVPYGFHGAWVGADEAARQRPT